MLAHSDAKDLACLSLDQLLTLSFERATALQTYWNLYIADAIGIAAFDASAKITALDARIFIAMIFWVFVSVNLSAMVDVLNQRSALLTVGPKQYSDLADKVQDSFFTAVKNEWLLIFGHKSPSVPDILAPPSKAGYIFFHLAVDVAVTLVILIPWPGLRGSPAATPQ
jgi:hypothetical protein